MGGVSVSRCNTPAGSSLLCLAAVAGSVSSVQLLLEAKCSMRADSKGQTPLHFAASQSHTSVVELLLKGGASADDTNNDGKTALELATAAGDSDTVVALGGSPLVDEADE